MTYEHWGSAFFAFDEKQVYLAKGKRVCKACGAISEESEKTLEEAGVFNLNAFSKVTEDLVNKKRLGKTKFQKYYLNIQRRK